MAEEERKSRPTSSFLPLPVKSMGDMLVREKLVSVEQLRNAAAEASKTGQHIGAALNALGYVDKAQLVDFLSRQYQVPSIDLSSGLPAEGKAVIAKGNVTGELVGQANTLFANDQGSLPALAAEAAKTTANGEIDVKLGESYWTYGRFDEAVASLQKGIEKGNLKDMADAQTTLGIALLDAGKKDEALKMFNAAAAANATVSPVAHAWALFLQRSAAA